MKGDKHAITGLTLASGWLNTTSPIFVNGPVRTTASTTDPDNKID